LRHAQLQLTASARAQAYVNVGEAWIRVARSQNAPGFHRHALECANQALTRAPGDAGALRLQALVWLDAHRFQETRALAQQLLAQDQNDPQVWGILSDTELELGHIEAASVAAQHMLDLKPGLLSYGRAAHLRWLTGDSAGAKQLYKLAIGAGQQQQDPEPRAWLTVQAAWVFWHEGDYAGARRGFELALSTLPDYAPALEGLGHVALAQADDHRAVAWLERAQARHPLTETAWWLGDAYTRLGDQGHASAMYREVERLGAQADERTLSLFYGLRGTRSERALKLAEHAYSQRADCYSKDALAFAFYRSGRRQEAAQLAREVVALGVPDARLWQRAGLVLRAAQDPVGEPLLARARTVHPHIEHLMPSATEDGDVTALAR
jgi:tetratricopeptide (TPR) repeat protein